MPSAPKPRLRHVPVRLRVSIDPEKWPPTGDLDGDVRRAVVAAVKTSDTAERGLIVDVRRDRL